MGRFNRRGDAKFRTPNLRINKYEELVNTNALWSNNDSILCQVILIFLLSFLIQNLC